jgi:hypothetical protein
MDENWTCSVCVSPWHIRSSNCVGSGTVKTSPFISAYQERLMLLSQYHSLTPSQNRLRHPRVLFGFLEHPYWPTDESTLRAEGTTCISEHWVMTLSPLPPTDKSKSVNKDVVCQGTCHWVCPRSPAIAYTLRLGPRYFSKCSNHWPAMFMQRPTRQIGKHTH